jgi:SnoaL-like domain
MTADTEANKAVVARHYAILRGGDPAEWDEIMAEGFVSHHPHASGRGRDRYRNAAAAYSTVFSDFAPEVQRMVAEDDCVAAHFIVRGRHTSGSLRPAVSSRSRGSRSIASPTASWPRPGMARTRLAGSSNSGCCRPTSARSGACGRSCRPREATPKRTALLSPRSAQSYTGHRRMRRVAVPSVGVSCCGAAAMRCVPGVRSSRADRRRRQVGTIAAAASPMRAAAGSAEALKAQAVAIVDPLAASPNGADRATGSEYAPGVIAQQWNAVARRLRDLGATARRQKLRSLGRALVALSKAAREVGKCVAHDDDPTTHVDPVESRCSTKFDDFEIAFGRLLIV